MFVRTLFVLVLTLLSICTVLIDLGGTNAKRKQVQITFDTQLMKTTLLQQAMTIKKQLMSFKGKKTSL